jgi:predicted lysophospholipase L1 biosynthesis ABC-type transport system permease subunit
LYVSSDLLGFFRTTSLTALILAVVAIVLAARFFSGPRYEDVRTEGDEVTSP